LSRTGISLLALWLLAVAAPQAVTQELTAVWLPVVSAGDAKTVADDGSTPSWLPPVASAVLPGTGQLLQGNARGAVYLAIEAVLLLRFFTFYGEGRQESDRYRDLAYSVARAPFQPAIRDTAFEYFEQVAKYIDSGPFDADPGPGFAPPVEESSYNGSIWLLAQQTFFVNPDSTPDPGSPEYQRALEFYRARAVGPNFLWSWRNAGLEQDLYRGSIEQSDESFRRATQHLGLLLANHLISAVDAFITGRLGADDRLTVRSGLSPGARGDPWQWSTGVAIAF
jgi:hypothetical protein